MASQKQKAFVAEYIKDFNATQAAIRAGYSPRTAGQIGHRLLKNIQIAKKIAEEIERRTMGADEVLLKIADQARGSVEDFVAITAPIKDPETGAVTGGWQIDLQKAEAAGKLHLIKKLKYNAAGYPEIELHDAQAALEKLARTLGLFKDHLTLDDTGLTDEKRASRIMAVLAAARTRRDHEVDPDGGDS